MILTDKQVTYLKLVGFAILLILCLWAGAAWKGRAITQAVTEHETTGTSLLSDATSHLGSLPVLNQIIAKDQAVVSAQQQVLDKALAAMQASDQKLQNLIKAQADLSQRYEQALQVIDAKNEVIAQQTTMLQAKDKIISDQDTRYNECVTGATAATNAAREYKAALDIAKQVKQVKFSVGGSYDPANKDYGIMGLYHKEMFFIGGEVRRVTCTPTIKETRAEIKVGFNLY